MIDSKAFSQVDNESGHLYRDAVKATPVFGAKGSGKTSGSGKPIFIQKMSGATTLPKDNPFVVIEITQNERNVLPRKRELRELTENFNKKHWRELEDKRIRYHRKRKKSHANKNYL